MDWSSLWLFVVKAYMVFSNLSDPDIPYYEIERVQHHTSNVDDGVAVAEPIGSNGMGMATLKSKVCYSFRFPNSFKPFTFH